MEVLAWGMSMYVPSMSASPQIARAAGLHDDDFDQS